MHKKYRIKLPLGEKVYFTTPLNRLGDVLPHVYLESFKIDKGRVEWVIRTHTGQHILGGVQDRQRNPIFNSRDEWVTLFIPVTLHLDKAGLAPDFLFNVPGMVSIERIPFSRSS